MTSGCDLLDGPWLLSPLAERKAAAGLAGSSSADEERCGGDTADQLPSLDSSGRTRPGPLKTGYRAQLKRLWLQKTGLSWIELASQMILRRANHFWLDLQWVSLGRDSVSAGQPWDSRSDAVLSRSAAVAVNVSQALKGWHGIDSTPLLTEVSPLHGSLKSE